MLQSNSIVENSKTLICADITNLQRVMSSLEINIVPNIDSATISSPTSLERRQSLRHKSTTNLHKTSHHVIAKPKKNTKSSPTTENEIRKFYLNQKLSKLKPTLLETIFENDDEDATERTNDQDDITRQLTLIGNKKIKRSLSFHTVPHTTKTLVQKRRRRIQTVLGGKTKTKKISMDTFMKRLKTMQDSHQTFDEEKEQNQLSATYRDVLWIIQSVIMDNLMDDDDISNTHRSVLNESIRRRRKSLLVEEWLRETWMNMDDI